MSLVKLKDTGGNTVHLNPDHVIFVTASAKDGSVLLGQAAVVLLNGLQLSVLGSPDEVSSLLDGWLKSGSEFSALA